MPSKPAKAELVRLNRLAWRLLEAKFSYYCPEQVHESWRKELTITDSEYDKLENEYLSLCKKHGKAPTAQQVVGFGATPACNLIRSKYSSKKERKQKVTEV